jgi:site-specific DNA-methyltransferase (adenine-specific)
VKNLYYGDNLEVLRESIKDESIDLIYLDPPFNSKRGYNLLFKSPDGHESNAQITAFDDSWHWNAQAEHEFNEILHQPNTDVAEMMQALRKFLGENDMMAYLTMMCNRLLELHRVLKPTGSLYLHCDPTASHYLKIVLDGVFGGQNFRNEIAWCYRGGGSSKTDFGKRHDIIFRYTKTEEYSFFADAVRIPYQAEGLGRTDDAMWGKHKGTDKVYKPNPLGKIPEDWWLINILNANDPERLGYPTQKPLALLERIIKASCPENGTVLDPFCGCGTI